MTHVGQKVPTVSIVVPCRNCTDLLGRQLAALAGQRWSGTWEVVVADNGSTDGLPSVAERFRNRFPELRVVDASAKQGAAYARNVGVKAATGDVVLFCDADDEVGEGWLAAMAVALREHDFVAARIDRERLNPSWVKRSRSFDGLLDSDPPFLPYSFSAALGVRRSKHLAVGGFDETFTVSCEDRDYCYRLQLAGTRLHLVSDAVIHYRLRDTFRGIYRNARTYARGNVLLYSRYRKHGLRQPSKLRSVGSWMLLLPALVPALRSREHFAQWCYRLGWLVGRLQGSLRYRVLAL